MGAPGSYVDRGVYVAQVGARFERDDLMEWRHVVVTAEQNTAAAGYGPSAGAGELSGASGVLACWARFYGQCCAALREARFAALLQSASSVEFTFRR